MGTVRNSLSGTKPPKRGAPGGRLAFQWNEMKFSVNMQDTNISFLVEFGYHIFIIVFLANILLGKLVFLVSFKAIDLEYYYSDFSENL